MVRALRDFTLHEVAEQLGKLQHSKTYSSYRVELKPLIDAGWVEELQSRELHLGTLDD